MNYIKLLAFSDSLVCIRYEHELRNVISARKSFSETSRHQQR